MQEIIGSICVTSVAIVLMLLLSEDVLFGDESPSWFKNAGGSVVIVAIVNGFAWLLIEIWS